MHRVSSCHADNVKNRATSIALEYPTPYLFATEAAADFDVASRYSFACRTVSMWVLSLHLECVV